MFISLFFFSFSLSLSLLSPSPGPSRFLFLREHREPVVHPTSVYLSSLPNHHPVHHHPVPPPPPPSPVSHTREATTIERAERVISRDVDEVEVIPKGRRGRGIPPSARGCEGSNGEERVARGTLPLAAPPSTTTWREQRRWWTPVQRLENRCKKNGGENHRRWNHPSCFQASSPS